jgi:hypothetical protein
VARSLRHSRLPVVGCAGLVALLLGISGAAAHGDGGSPGQRGHGAAGEVHTSIQAVAHGHGEDQGHTGAAEHGDQGGGNVATTTPSSSSAATSGPRRANVANPSLPLPTLAGLPSTSTGTGTSPGTANPTGATTTSSRVPAPAPARHIAPLRVPSVVAVVAPQPVPTPAPAPPTPAPLPPLVLIPPIALPAPPVFSSAGGSIGVVPLVVVLLAMAALGTILGVRILRRSR